MQNCHWGRPCNCMNCRGPVKTTCERCYRNPGYTILDSYIVDHTGIGSYSFTTLCHECSSKRNPPQIPTVPKIPQPLQTLTKQKRNRKPKDEQTLLKEKLKKIRETKEKLQRVYIKEKLHKLRFKKCYIKYAHDKFRSQIGGLDKNKFIKRYKDVLYIEKVKGRWICCKNRTDAIDFNYYHTLGD